jgi:adenosylcobinamide-GDP ribazoletransferase
MCQSTQCLRVRIFDFLTSRGRRTPQKQGARAAYLEMIQVRQKFLHQLRLGLIAVQFLTRVPLPAGAVRWMGFEPEWLNQSARYFPVVGTLVGLWGCAVLVVAKAVFTPAVAVGLSMVATVWLTGAFHEDGWADTCDALGGGASVTPERARAIMKDSRIGAYGAIGLVLMFGLKAATLTALPWEQAVPALLLAHTASRAAAVALIFGLPYAGDVAHAKAKPLAQQISGAELALAMAWVVCVGAGLAIVAWASQQPVPWTELGASLLVLVACTAVCARWFRKRLGGYTGDTLGATQQLTELCVLLAWLGCLMHTP